MKNPEDLIDEIFSKYLTSGERLSAVLQFDDAYRLFLALKEASEIVESHQAECLISSDKFIREFAKMVKTKIIPSLPIEYEDIYPLTIIKDRYGGVYSGGTWTAFNLRRDEIPEEVGASDAIDFNFDHNKYPYGAGETPHMAIKDLAEQLKQKEDKNE